ncbi:LLM class flavin-dependent oxidoreductase [Rhizobium leguminosarum]|uniref:LLM class flavin-dependent oxidoreductase n=1 Tax=Rhizobium leguminosarum TaxID=384 RepID=UPI0013F156AD|nr:LLM class flavin-dependent oxidoreductase [Rhizobium leguminosarum]
MGNISISHIGFLTPGNYPDGDPLSGLERTLEQLQYGEDLGFDSAWVRQRHLEPGISSASAFLAAATQRTSRIELGTAVIPIGYESPYRLAEDLATVDVLSGGRLNIGVSAGRPLHAELIAPLVFDGDWTGYDFSHDRVLRFADNLRGTYLGDEQTLIKTPFGPQRPRLQPYAKGLIDRIWYGGGSQRSAEWAGRNGFNLLTGNMITGEGTDDFFTAQSRLIEIYRAADTQRRVALGRVIVPFDSADAATRRRYRDYTDGRHSGRDIGAAVCRSDSARGRRVEAGASLRVRARAISPDSPRLRDADRTGTRMGSTIRHPRRFLKMRSSIRRQNNHLTGNMHQ